MTQCHLAENLRLIGAMPLLPTCAFIAVGDNFIILTYSAKGRVVNIYTATFNTTCIHYVPHDKHPLFPTYRMTHLFV
jgi:hypothetical protein